VYRGSGITRAPIAFPGTTPRSFPTLGVMEPFAFLDQAFPNEPLWPDEPGPYLFLLETSGPAVARVTPA
jgi:hypothetical protein